MAWKRFFFDVLWPARGKWGPGAGSSSSSLVGDALSPSPTSTGVISEDFKINVCVRFRPLAEEAPDSKLGLPLHQYIKLQRQQAKKMVKA
jgi:hypothetical protein